MGKNSELDLNDARPFAAVLNANVFEYFSRSCKNNPSDYKFSKLYSNYCHDVILEYSEFCMIEYFKTQKENRVLFNVTDWKEFGDCIVSQMVRNCVPDRHCFVYFARVALIEICLRLNDIKADFNAEEIIARLAEIAVKRGILRKNYDASRKFGRDVVYWVYIWRNKYLTEHLNVHDRNMASFGSLGLPCFHNLFNELERKGDYLLIKWKLKYELETLTKNEFVRIALMLAEESRHVSNIETAILILIVRISLLSMDSLEFECVEGVELAIDMVSILCENL